MAEKESAKDRVLDAAERAFAASGFSGASMKAIARDAGVAQGLLHYHFDTKEGLYRGVIARRSACINEARLALLEEVDLDAPDAVERIFFAFLSPPFDTGSTGSGYPQMLARLVVGDALDQELIREHYDACARAFIAALAHAMPDVGRYDLSHCYQLAIGAMIASFSPTDRVERLAGNGGTPAETAKQTVGRLVKFCAQGTRAFQNTSTTRRKDIHVVSGGD